MGGYQHTCLLATTLACVATVGLADDGLIWLDVVADRPINHGVMVRGPFADAHEKLTLTGPAGFVATGNNGGFTAYAVTGSADREVRTAHIGPARTEVRLGPVEFLLVPAKRLVEGQPAAAVTHGVYEARPIRDATDAIDGVPAAAGRPTHLCLPADYRHHFDHVPVAEADRGLLVCTARATQEKPAAVRIADDFGLNRLVPAETERAGAWITVHSTER